MNFTSIFHERLRSFGPDSVSPLNLALASNAHAYRLYVVKELALALLFCAADISSAKPSIMT